MRLFFPRASRGVFDAAAVAVAAVLLLASTTSSSLAAEPLTLKQAVQAALQGNPELQAFAFQFRAQEARGQQAALRPAPEASVDLENFLGSGENKGLDSVEATFALSQVLELGGKRDARMAAAQAGLGTLSVAQQAAQLDVLAEVARRFIAVAQRQEQVRLADAATELAAATVQASERRVQAGKSPHAELDRARVGLDRAQLDRTRAAAQMDTARKQLSALWGDPSGAIDGKALGEVRADLYNTPPSGSFEELTARLARNPDLLRFASEQRLRDAELRLATTLRKPNLGLSAGLRRLEVSNDQAFVASISVPLFANRRSSSLIAEAQANRDLVGAERHAAEVSARATLYTLHRELLQAVAETQTLQNVVAPRVKEALDETQYAFDRGRYSYLELVDAQREFLSTRADLIEAAAQAHTLRAEIERLTNAPLTALPNSN